MTYSALSKNGIQSPWSQSAYQDALRFAASRHAAIGQLVPGSNLPYAVHLSWVAQEVMAALACRQGSALASCNGTLAVQCALLHDVLEDTDTVFSEIVDLFGTDVANGVLALTKDTSLDGKAAQMQDSLTRILMQPKEVQMVKLADRISNLQPPPASWDDEKIERYRREAQGILDALGDADAYLAQRLAGLITLYGR